MILSFTVLLACVSLGLGLKCYIKVDNDKVNLTDDDLMNTLGIVEIKQCMKTTTTLGSTKSVVRAGLPIKQSNGCTTSGHVEICLCDTDACNAAHTSVTLLLPLLVLPALLTRWL